MQKTFSIKQADITRRWWVIDAEDKVLGRLSASIARILQGKHKPQYTPHMDTGDYVVVVNASKVRLTTKNKDKKVYYHHSTYIGGLKAVPFPRMIKEKPEEVIRIAVKGMLPKTKLGRAMFRKLKVYAGSQHDHAAQKPEPLEVSA